MKIFGRKSRDSDHRPVVNVATNSGMLALWRESAFADVDGYEAWETRVNERLTEAIGAGELVPVGIQSDGAFGVSVVVAPDAPTDRESTYTVVTSDPYLLLSDGGPIVLSGIEKVGVREEGALTLRLSEGPYAARVSIIAWDEEPGAQGSDGMPTRDALPDFLIAVARCSGTEDFRTSENTFDPRT